MKRLLPLLFLTVALAAEEERPRVLLLFSNDRMLPANQDMEAGIRSAVADDQVEFFGEFLDAVRFPGQDQWRNMERFLIERHQAKPPAACICIGPQAVEFLAAHRNSLFPDVPVIITGVTPPQLASLSSLDGVAGRPMDWNIRPLLDALPAIRPEVRRILVVTGAAEFDKVREQEAKNQIDPYRQKFDFEFSHGEDLESLKNRLSRLSDDTLVFYISYFKSPDGRFTVPQEVARELSAASSVPVACVFDTYLGTGVLGGPVMPFHAEGRFIGELLQRVLREGDASAIGILPPGEPRLAFDDRVLRRFGWKTGKIPSSAELRFRRRSLWEDHKYAVLAAIAVVLTQSGLIFGLLVARARHRSAERERTLSESRFRKVFHGSPIPISIFRKKDGVIVDVNPAWEETMHVSRDSAVGSSHKDLGFTIEGMSGHDIGDYLATGKALRDFEQDVVLPDGKRRLISVSTELLDLHGEPCFISMAQDVTNRHEAEEARRMLSRATRIGILGELTASIAHEVNQPLGAILSNTEAAELILQSEAPPLDEIRAILADIRRDDLRASEVIRQVRAMVSHGETKHVPLPIAELAENVVSMVRHDGKRRGIRIDCRSAPDLPQVSGEKVQLEQILLNLLLNAMDALADPDLPKKEIHVSVAREENDGRVRVTVADTGPGIPNEMRKHVFDSFVTTKKDGMGLGLALSRSIAEAHGGTLVHDDSASYGATFHLILPSFHDK
jgi:PAS domain S-box-containing protein